jgi:hypothetical protein
MPAELRRESLVQEAMIAQAGQGIGQDLVGEAPVSIEDPVLVPPGEEAENAEDQGGPYEHIGEKEEMFAPIELDEIRDRERRMGKKPKKDQGPRRGAQAQHESYDR